MQKDDVREAQEIPAEEASPALLGLAPTDAREWLELQSVLAWEPEAVGSRLRAGETAKEILNALRGQLELPHPESHELRSGSTAGGRATAVVDARSRSMKRLEESGLRVVPLTDPAYPEALAALVDAPPVLLVRGSVAVLKAPAIAIVGARAATRSARETARCLARELAAAGLTIVSGLARGIDAEAHRGALEAKGRTIGVLACGLDQIYPPEHRNLAQEIAEVGAVISEMPFGIPPRPAHFPLRNRIISGLCLGVIVVEARRRSGSLITVRHALAQGREVFVVPGSIDGPFAEGTNQLLRDGARAICCAGDVIEDLGFRVSLDGPGAAFEASRGPVPAASSISALSSTSPASSIESRILRALEGGPVTRDELIQQVACAGAELAGGLLELELAGRILMERDGRIHARWR
jgi:DNA processing protein